jgi:hypothetical protein
MHIARRGTTLNREVSRCCIAFRPGSLSPDQVLVGNLQRKLCSRRNGPGKKGNPMSFGAE